MQTLLTNYLFQNNRCPLPSLGEWVVVTEPAVTQFAEKQIQAPKPVIKFNKETSDTADLVSYIASKTNQSQLDAENSLFNFCKQIRDRINNGEAINWPHTGQFFKDSSGQMTFEPVLIDEVFVKPVPAERVIHPDAGHAMRVGDTETTNTAMESYFAAPEKVSKDRWWIWALVITALAIGAIAYNIYSHKGNFSPANTCPINISF